MSKTVMVSKTADKTARSVKNTAKPKPKIVKNGIMEVMFGPGPKKKNDLVFTSPNAKTENMYEYEVDAKGNVVSKSGKMDMTAAKDKYEKAQYSPKYGHVLWAFNDHDLGKKLDSAHAAHTLHNNPKNEWARTPNGWRFGNSIIKKKTDKGYEYRTPGMKISRYMSTLEGAKTAVEGQTSTHAVTKPSIKRNGSKFCVISKTGGFDCFDSIDEAIENKSVGAIILRDDDFKKINSLRGKLLYDKACEISRPNTNIKSNPKMLEPNKQSDYFWHRSKESGRYSYCFLKDDNTYCNAIIDSDGKKCTYVIFADSHDPVNCTDIVSAKRIIENRFKGKQSVKSNPTDVSQKIAACFRAGKKCKIGDTETDGTSILLYGKKIVSKRADGIYVTNAGSDSKLTKDRLSPFCKLSVKSGERYLNGKAWDGSWKKLTEFDYSGGVTKPTVKNPKNEWRRTPDGWRFGNSVIYKKTDKGYGYHSVAMKVKRYADTLADAKRIIESHSKIGGK